MCQNKDVLNVVKVCNVQIKYDTNDTHGHQSFLISENRI